MTTTNPDSTDSIVSVKGLTKTYEGGKQALNGVDLEIREGEILALLGPNGAGKTTLISVICGLVNATSGTITVGGYDHVKQYRQSRELIGLVPQELALGAFDVVENTVTLSRGLFGKKKERNSRLMTRRAVRSCVYLAA